MMTQPSSNTILRQRHWVLLGIRVLALLMIVYGTALIVQATGSALGFARTGASFLMQLFSVYWDANYNPFWYGLSLVAPGLALACFSQRLARWIVPALNNQCPQCGYALKNLQSHECPECGYRLGGD